MELLIYFYQQFQFFLHSRSSSHLMQARFNFSHYKELTQARQQAHMLHLQEADHLVAKTTVTYDGSLAYDSNIALHPKPLGTQGIQLSM